MYIKQPREFSKP